MKLPPVNDTNEALAAAARFQIATVRRRLRLASRVRWVRFGSTRDGTVAPPILARSVWRFASLGCRDIRATAAKSGEPPNSRFRCGAVRWYLLSRKTIGSPMNEYSQPLRWAHPNGPDRSDGDARCPPETGQSDGAAVTPEARDCTAITSRFGGPGYSESL